MIRAHASPHRDYGDPGVYEGQSRFEMWTQLAAADAIAWSPPGSTPSGFWSVFSYDSCASVLRRGGPFTSRYGMMLGFDESSRDPSGDRMMVVSDGEHHHKLRRLVGPYLSRNAGGHLRGEIEVEVKNGIERILDRGSTDIVSEFSARIPAGVVCAILGVPREDREDLIRLTGHAFGGHDPSYSKTSPQQAHIEILAYFADLIAERAKRPGDDLVSSMLREPTLTSEDVLLNCDNVLIGGNETTRHAITALLHLLATSPAVHRDLEQGAPDIAAVVEEVLRLASPAMHVLRVATADVLVGNQLLLAGSAVVAWLPAANRDARYFSDPGEFIVGRKFARHIAFGLGAHHCLGAALARAELSELVVQVLRSIKAIHLESPPVWLRALSANGYQRCQMRVLGR